MKASAEFSMSHTRMHIFFVFKVVIYKFFIFPVGYRSLVLYHLSFAIFSWSTSCMSSSPPRMCAAICRDFSSSLIPPTRRLYLYPSSLFLFTSASIQVKPPFLFPTSFLFTHTYPLSSPLSSRPTLFSPSLLFCVFCFGAVIFRLISEVMHFLQIKEEARLPPPPSSSSSSSTPPYLLLLLPSLPSLPFSPPSAPQAREEIKEPPSFPC